MKNPIFEIAQKIEADYDKFGASIGAERESLELGIVMGALILAREVLRGVKNV